MPFRPTHLRYLVTVAEEGQLTRAARKLEIAQPALSQAISQLESELGLQLLVRHPRGVTLTEAGEAFLPKARIAVEAERDVELTASALAGGGEETLTVGFLGPPPSITARELFAAFHAEQPGANVAFRDLPFPQGQSRSWLKDVDVAFCHQPELDASVKAQLVRVEPRAVVAHRSHPVAAATELTVDAVLDETFIGYAEEVQATWAGFHSLDDHRGGPPSSRTDDRARTGLQMLGIISAGGAITTLPACDGHLIESGLPDLVSIPLRDARPAELSLICPASGCPPLVDELLGIAARLATERARSSPAAAGRG
jgi:DNA-binding transcriptional LysR family regulator